MAKGRVGQGEEERRYEGTLLLKEVKTMGIKGSNP